MSCMPSSSLINEQVDDNMQDFNDEIIRTGYHNKLIKEECVGDDGKSLSQLNSQLSLSQSNFLSIIQEDENDFNMIDDLAEDGLEEDDDLTLNEKMMNEIDKMRSNQSNDENEQRESIEKLKSQSMPAMQSASDSQCSNSRPKPELYKQFNKMINAEEFIKIDVNDFKKELISRVNKMGPPLDNREIRECKSTLCFLNEYIYIYI